MSRTPFVRLPEENSTLSSRQVHQDNDMSSLFNGYSNASNTGILPPTSVNYPTLMDAGSRLRGGPKQVDLSKCDEEASAHLLTARRPPGDLCDCLFPWRRLCSLQKPPSRQKMSENVEVGFPLPFGIVWFVRDCAGWVCMVFTWLLIAYGEFVMACIILPQLPSAIVVCVGGTIYHIFASLALISHLKTVFTNPGAVPIGNATKEAVLRIYQASGANLPLIRCPKCFCIKPDRAHHCSCCRRCVRKMDHHCPWVNNCVGEGNQKFFVLFNLYIFLMSMTALVMIISFFLFCFSEFGKCEYPGSYSSSASLINNIFFISEAIFFGLFTSIMACSQVSAIFSDETVVESMKRNKGVPRPRRSKCEALASVFGRPFSWRWFSPFHPPAPLTPVVPLPPRNDDGDLDTRSGASLEPEMQCNGHHQHQHHHHHFGAYTDVYLV